MDANETDGGQGEYCIRCGRYLRPDEVVALRGGPCPHCGRPWEGPGAGSQVVSGWAEDRQVRVRSARGLAILTLVALGPAIPFLPGALGALSGRPSAPSGAPDFGGIAMLLIGWPVYGLVVGVIGGTGRRLPFLATLAALAVAPLLLAAPGAARVDGWEVQVQVLALTFVILLLGLWPAYAVGYGLAAWWSRDRPSAPAPPPGPQAYGGGTTRS